MSESLQKIERTKAAILAEAADWKCTKGGDAERFRIRFLGTKGLLRQAFELMRGVDKVDKKEVGLLLNELKQTLEMQHTALLETKNLSKVSNPKQDVTLPGIPLQIGGQHPIRRILQEVISIFNKLGYVVQEAQEIEDEWHNFTALNIPEWHPARDMQDTFYVSTDPSFVLRTHTSNVQVRTMLSQKPPIRMIAPGRVYRNETISARSHCFFHQIEGMYIDENVSLADLKYSLYTFVKAFFGEDTKIRFRPSYFPFTEPSAEMDVSCFICNQEGCSVCKQTGWVEILGCGMMHPKLFENCNIDRRKYTGFAFGMGIERLTMLKYQITDIRKFYEGDLAFLTQFRGI